MFSQSELADIMYDKQKAFAPEIEVIKVIYSIDRLKRFIVYKNDRTKKASIYDIFTFFIVPFLIAIACSFLIEIDVFVKASELLITIFSIMATILFSFLALLMDKKYNKESDDETKEKKKFKQVSTETYISITMTIIYSLVSVAVAILLLIINNNIVAHVLNVLMLYFIIKIVFNFLMILKRMFILLE